GGRARRRRHASPGAAAAGGGRRAGTWPSPRPLPGQAVRAGVVAPAAGVEGDGAVDLERPVGADLDAEQAGRRGYGAPRPLGRRPAAAKGVGLVTWGDPAARASMRSRPAGVGTAPRAHSSAGPSAGETSATVNPGVAGVTPSTRWTRSRVGVEDHPWLTVPPY